MSRTALAMNPPDDMPVWARLRLAEAGVRFHQVTCWVRPEASVVNVFTATSFVTLHKG